MVRRLGVRVLNCTQLTINLWLMSGGEIVMEGFSESVYFAQ